MKRILCTLLTIAMLLSVTVCTFAAEISEIEVTVTLPKCGDTISPGAIQIVDNSPIGLNCTGLYVFDNEKDFSSIKAMTDFTAFQAYAGSNAISGTEVYQSKSYLLVLSVNKEGYTYCDIKDMVFSANDDIEARVVSKSSYDGNEVLYCYIEFTPTEADSGTDSGDDDDSGSDPGTGGSTDSSTNENATDVVGSKDVTVSYDDSNAANIIYSVNITWGSLEFKYQPLQGEWDPETHSYENMVEPGWSFDPGANAITVTNHSNNAITAHFTYTAASGFNNILGKLYDSEDAEIAQALLATAEGTKVENAPTYTAYLQLFGTLDKEKTNTVTSGTVTVTIE